MVKLFITGVSGQVGSEVLRLSEHKNYGIYFSNVPRFPHENLLKVDIRDRDHVFNVVKKIDPDWIIHCAASTKVDWCETNKDQATEINIDGTKNLVDASKEVNSKFLFVSTDYVFDGNKGNYKETDETCPVNFYGQTKLDAELYVKTLKDYLIMRTSHVFSPLPDNFVLWVIEKLKTGGIDCPQDMISSPTLALELAEAILKAVGKNLSGIYHSASAESISRYDFAKKIAKAFRYDESKVIPIKMIELKFAAKRPINSSLDISKILSEGIKFSDVDEALKRLKDEMIVLTT